MSEELKISRRHPGWWFLGAVVPCLITSYFSYRSAKVQAEEKAAAGYDTLLAAQKELSQAFKEHLQADDKVTAELVAKVDLLDKMVLRLYTVERSVPSHHAELSRPLPPPAQPVIRHFPAYNAKALPETLDAAMQQAAKK